MKSDRLFLLALLGFTVLPKTAFSAINTASQSDISMGNAEVSVFSADKTDRSQPTSKTGPKPTDSPSAAGQPASATPQPKQQIASTQLPTGVAKGTTPPQYLNWRPRQSLGAVASQRRDELSGKSTWEEKQPWSLHRILGLPDWVSLTLEERVRYEDYDTPWIKGNTQGQHSLPIQTVLWGEARFSDTFRMGAEFWDARQWGSSHPNRLTTAMVNTGQFAQIYAAWINRDLFGLGVDSETKAGQMTMDIGSRRLIARAAFRNVQYQYVGMQNRLREKNGDWELVTFANVPMRMLPDNNNIHALKENEVIWNRPQTDTVLTGFLFNRKLSWQSQAELYTYYLHEGPINPLKRNLWTPGARFYRNSLKGEFDWELETIGQTGSARLKEMAKTKDIGAVMQHAHIGYTFDSPWTPRFLIQWDYASSHFDTLFSPTVFEYGPTGILGLFNRNNINSPGYRLFVAPHPDLLIYIANRFWWLADPRSTTGWSTAKLVDPTGKAGSYLGQSWELNARWDAHENVAFQAGWQVLQKGGFAMNAPGAPKDHGNVNYFFVQTELRF